MDYWVIGISDGKPHEYKIGNVNFEVFSEFEPTKAKITIKNKLERTLTNDFVDLTGKITNSKMGIEYVCSTAGKED